MRKNRKTKLLNNPPKEETTMPVTDLPEHQEVPATPLNPSEPINLEQRVNSVPNAQRQQQTDVTVAEQDLPINANSVEYYLQTINEELAFLEARYKNEKNELEQRLHEYESKFSQLRGLFDSVENE